MSSLIFFLQMLTKNFDKTDRLLLAAASIAGYHREKSKPVPKTLKSSLSDVCKINFSFKE